MVIILLLKEANTRKDKVIVFQPFGQSTKVEGNFIFDPTGRSFGSK